MATKAADLYDEDFYAWTQQQAEALRTHFQGDNRLDVEHLAEEVEDLGKSELHAVESFVENVIEHLLKLDYSGWVEARNHWRAEVRRVQDAASSARSRRGSASRSRPSSMCSIERARRAAARSLHQREPDFVRRLPETCPYDWDAIWHRDVLAEAGIDLSDGPDEWPKKRRRKRGA